MPETEIADGPGHANLLRQRHLQTPHAFASSERDAIVQHHIPRLILGALGGVWRVGMAKSEVGLWHSASEPGGIT